jgi:hypothetical protein
LPGVFPDHRVSIIHRGSSKKKKKTSSSALVHAVFAKVVFLSYLISRELSAMIAQVIAAQPRAELYER